MKILKNTRIIVPEDRDSDYIDDVMGAEYTEPASASDSTPGMWDFVDKFVKAYTNDPLKPLTSGLNVSGGDGLVYFPTYSPDGTEPAQYAWWDDKEEAPVVKINNDVLLAWGGEIAPTFRNATGSTIADATPVMRVGTLGSSGRVLIAPAIADGSVSPANIIGLTTEAIANNSNGKVTILGNVRDVNTTGDEYGETWEDNDTIYVSQTIAGYLTNVKPTSGLIVAIGVVVYAHATQGIIGVKPSFSFTTLEGYGITDALSLGETSTTAYRGDRGAISYSHSQDTYGNNPHGTIFATINNKPTTLSGYGITDAYTQTYLNTRIGNIETLLTSDDTTLDEIQEIVDYIKQNRSDLENLSASNIAGLDTWGDGRYILSSGEIRPMITTSYGLFGSATLSTWVNGGGFSRFGHADYNLSANYGFLQGSNGSVFISGSSNTVAGDLSVEGYITATGTVTASPATADTHLATLGQAKALASKAIFSKESGTIDSSQFSPTKYMVSGSITVNTTSIYEMVVNDAGTYWIEIDVMCSNTYTPEIEYSDNNWSTKTLQGTDDVLISTSQYNGTKRMQLVCPSGRKFRLRWGGNTTILTYMRFSLERIS